MVYLPGDALGQQVGKGTVDRGVRLAKNERQFRRIGEGRPAEKIKHMSVGVTHTSRVTFDRHGRQSPIDTADASEGVAAELGWQKERLGNEHGRLWTCFPAMHRRLRTPLSLQPTHSLVHESLWKQGNAPACIQ